jgi:asparagine synthase (glutamine-hydrolysing)
MKALKEKYLLKLATRHLVPDAVTRRTKQPYRAPDAQSFFDCDDGAFRHDYVAELLSPQRIADDGLFHPQAVERLVAKARAGRAVGVKDNMALVGILSTQLLVDQFQRSFRPAPDTDCNRLKVSLGNETFDHVCLAPIESIAPLHGA